MHDYFTKFNNLLKSQPDPGYIDINKLFKLTPPQLNQKTKTNNVKSKPSNPSPKTQNS